MTEDLSLIADVMDRLRAATGVKDIACHRIADGKLIPLLKTETDRLGMERWKQVHADNPVYIRNDSLLTALLERPEVVRLDDVANDPRSQEEFFLFGIDSLMIAPVRRGDEVEGLLIAASIGELHTFTDEEAAAAEELAALLGDR
ncbi:GAF domain-containing protein [Paenibacillus pasadenensis]|uniref:GAF domain-containing protein n=1 Tax=Paenibacillus pasadenensis TaxID=217090 RepID=A0A2N5N2M4_9BACL|nr:GAF domain-containing protein [Paenibacillus pasadenensis]PLT44580.1 hypothetical protein B8V81_3011 [Paenibacillus pasadenensis]